MARRSLGKVSVDFVARTSQFKEGLDSAQKRSQRFAKNIRKAGRQARFTGTATSNPGQAAMSLGRALEDASAVAGTQGFSGALRAAGNNVSQFAMMLGGPLIGSIVGVGTVLAGTLIPKLFSSGDAAEKTKEKVDKTSDALKKMKKRAEKVAEIGRLQIEIETVIREGPLSGLEDRISKLQNKLSIKKQKLDILPDESEAAKKLRGEIEQTEKKLRKLKSSREALSGFQALSGIKSDVSQKQPEGRKDIKSAIGEQKEKTDELREAREKLSSQIAEASKRRNEARSALQKMSETERTIFADRVEKLQAKVLTLTDAMQVWKDQLSDTDKAIKKSKDRIGELKDRLNETAKGQAGQGGAGGSKTSDGLKKFAEKQKQQLKESLETPKDRMKEFGTRLGKAVEAGLMTRDQARLRELQKRDPQQRKKEILNRVEKRREVATRDVGAARLGSKKAATTILDATQKSRAKGATEGEKEQLKKLDEQIKLLKELKNQMKDGGAGMVESFQ